MVAAFYKKICGNDNFGRLMKRNDYFILVFLLDSYIISDDRKELIKVEFLGYIIKFYNRCIKCYRLKTKTLREIKIPSIQTDCFPQLTYCLSNQSLSASTISAVTQFLIKKDHSFSIC